MHETELQQMEREDSGDKNGEKKNSDLLKCHMLLLQLRILGARRQDE